MSFDETRNAIMARTAALDADRHLGTLAAHAVNRPVGEWGETSLALAEAVAQEFLLALCTLQRCRALASGRATVTRRPPPDAA